MSVVTGTRTKAILLAFLVLFGIIICPAMAWRYEVTAEPLGGVLNAASGKVMNYTVDVSSKGDAIQRISVDIPTGATVNFTLTYGSSENVSGWMEYTNDGFYSQHTEVAIDADVQGYSYTGVQEIGRIDIVGYARSWTNDTAYVNGFIVYDSVFGVSERRAMAFYEVPAISDNVIYKFVLTANKPVAVAWYTNTRENVGSAATKTIFDVANEWLKFMLEAAGFAFSIITSLYYWLKFFFWDNLGMTVALYITLSMAFAARAAGGNPAKFLRQFFRDQVALWRFVIEMVRILVEIGAKLARW